MNCPQPQSLSQCVTENAVPTTNGDTWGQFEDKPFLYMRISKKSLYSRARVGTDSPEVSPLVPTLMGTGAFDPLHSKGTVRPARHPRVTATSKYDHALTFFDGLGFCFSRGGFRERYT